MKYIFNAPSLCLVLSLLTACGGGNNSDGKAVSEPTGSAPQAIAGVDKTVRENDSVVLDARASFDKDGDELSYQWVQLSGPSVTLSNTHSTQPSFVTPEVDATTSLVFELQVSDAKQEVKTDSVTITVLDRALDQQKKQLMVHPVNVVLTAQTDEVLSVPFEFRSFENAPKTAGLMLKLHWNSSLLSFNGLSEVLGINHLGVSPEMMDRRDEDQNPDTDKYVIISWLDYENAEWLSEVNLPVALFAAGFKPVKGGSGSTQITLSSHFTSPGFELHSQVVSVEL